MAEFALSEKYGSKEELEARIKNYEQEHNIQMYKRCTILHKFYQMVIYVEALKKMKLKTVLMGIDLLFYLFLFKIIKNDIVRPVF